jgi:hypothetical protein
MLRQDHLRTLKQTHQTASTVMPLVTAGLAIMSALIAAQERRTAHLATAHSESEHEEHLDRPRIIRVTTAPLASARSTAVSETTAEAPSAPLRERRVSLIGFLATLVRACLKVALGAVAVVAIVAFYAHLEKTNRAILLTVLITGALYLTERVARARQRR